MVKRSLQASAEGIRKAKQAFGRKHWTQQYLASQVGIATRQPIWRFFTGKPVDRYVFTEICFQLDLLPEEIAAEAVPESESPEAGGNIEAIVKKARAQGGASLSQHQEKIASQCATIRLLDLARPVPLEHLYVEVKILEETTSQRWLDLTDLKNLNSKAFDHSSLTQKQQRIAALRAVEKYQKLMVLGKPGSGKTTFLQFIAMECHGARLGANQIPIFILLKNFAEDARDTGNFDLSDYVAQQLRDSSLSLEEIEMLLEQGRGLILLDGLDEVSSEDSSIVIKNIRRFADKYYKNQLIISSRIAAYRYKFQGFTEVEIADFTEEQIAQFARNWFVSIAGKSPAQGVELGNQFINKLKRSENKPIRELVTTPLLLSLTCLVFQGKGDFPLLYSKLYQQAFELLLSRWDEARGIKRDEVYRSLSLNQKIKLLSRIAIITFTQGNYLFSSENIENIIANFWQDSGQKEEWDREVILQAIEAQHGVIVKRSRGVYSFSHLTLQEYLTARAIVTGGDGSFWQELIARIGEKQWREVFLLVAEMMPEREKLWQLMEERIGVIAANSPLLQQLLLWLENKTATLDAPYKKAAIRAFYFTFALPANLPLAGDLSLAIAIDPNLVKEQTGELGLDLTLNYALNMISSLTPQLFSYSYSSIYLALDLDHIPRIEKSLKESIDRLKDRLPSKSEGEGKLQAWWEAKGETWRLELIEIMRKHRNIGVTFQFSTSEWEILQQYYDANHLLLACLNRHYHLLPERREEMEDYLFTINN